MIKLLMCCLMSAVMIQDVLAGPNKSNSTASRSITASKPYNFRSGTQSSATRPSYGHSDYYYPYGLGITGLALSYSLLNDHDMSASDRDWVLDEINNGKPVTPPRLLAWREPSVRFNYVGVNSKVVPGQAVEIRVTALNSNGAKLPVVCDLRGASVTNGNVSILRWTPSSPGSGLMFCTASNQTEKRLLRVL